MPAGKVNRRSGQGVPPRKHSILTLPHGDPVAVELTSAIHGGDVDALRHMLAERPELASARMVGRHGAEGGWRTPLHAATDWPGYFPAAHTDGGPHPAARRPAGAPTIG